MGVEKELNCEALVVVPPFNSDLDITQLFCEEQGCVRSQRIFGMPPHHDLASKSGHPESNQGPSDCCSTLQSDALPTEL